MQRVIAVNSREFVFVLMSGYCMLYMYSRRTNSSVSVVSSINSNTKSHSSSRKTLVPYPSSLSSQSSPKSNSVTKSDNEYLRKASSSPAGEREVDDDDKDQVILSICWYRERIGGAFFCVSTRQVFIVEDKAESAPDFWVLRSLFREVSPKILVVGGKQDARLFKVVQELRGFEGKGNLFGKGISTSSNSEYKTTSSEGSIKKEFCGDSSDSPRNDETILPTSQSSVISSGTDTSPVALVIRPASEFSKFYEY
ncbi:hypothetical protein Anas_12418 [Armadillidium nasatum]|uniref:Uncharacterized protein n=1 Tax=Armadillidium nasatum TaxID=96803 RepID=A0A5N5TEE2_9CRUS|nr:hypothetical protein Anas_12418 [Armadillidium nasatum]